MESQLQKWVNLSYLLGAILLGYLVFSFFGKVSDFFDWEVRFRYARLVLRVVSVVSGIICFWVLYRHEQANQFMNEVMVELSRVTWPTQKDTSSATWIVMIMVMISGFILGFLDYIWVHVVKWIL